ncbi:hypothetical protein FQZ97_633200 [compost metagenome]
MLPGQADRQAFSKRINTFTVIHVKKPEVCHPLAGGFADGGEHGLGGNLAVHQQGQVAAHFGEARQLAELRQLALHHFGLQQLEQVDRLIQVQGLGQFRVQGTEVADQAPFPFDASGLARVQGGVFAGHEAEGVQVAGGAEDGFDVGLGVVEVHAVTAVGPAFRQARTAEHAGEHGLLLQAFELANEAQATFEQAHAGLLAVEVVLQRADQARPQRRTHGGHVGGDGVGQHQRLHARVEQFEQLGIDEAVGDGFMVTTGDQQATQGRQLDGAFGASARGQAGLRVANRQAVVAVEAAQLFDQVHFQADVEAVARHVHAPLAGAVGGDLEVQRGEQALDFGGVHFHAQHLRDALGTQGDRLDLRQVRFACGFDDGAGFAADDVQQQAGGALHGFAGELEVHATLEAVRGVGVQAIGTGLASDGDGVEEGGFEEQVASLGADAAVLATHDAGDGQGAGVVGDHQGVGTQGDFLAVEQDKLLALLRHAHADTAVDFGEVEGVHRLAEFEHHVVGDVDGGVDAAHVGTAQALDHPQRGRLGQVDVADHAAEVARAGSRGGDFHRAHFVMGRGNGGDLRAGDRRIVECTHFAGEAGKAQAVATVGGQAQFDDHVIQAEVGADVLAHGGVGGQFHQAVVVIADLQFGGRAEHAVGLDATQLGLLDLEVAGQFGADHGEGDLQAGAHVGRAAHDLEGLAAVADLADAQLVGVRVLFGAQHLAHDHAAEGTGHRGDAVDFEAGHGQTSHQLVAGYLRAYPAPQPLFTEFHPALLRDSFRTLRPSGIARGSAGRCRRTGASR